MLTIEQIRAARALLGWNQDTLAQEAGMSQTGIARIENGTNKPNSSTLEKIKQAFDRFNIEFIDNTGVKKSTGSVKIYEGDDACVSFLQHVYETLKHDDGDNEVVVNNVQEDRFMKWCDGYVETHVSRMDEVKAKFRIIVRDGDTNFVASNYSQYRSVSEDRFNEISYYVYKNFSALIDFTEKFIYVIDSPAVAKFYKAEFQRIWDRAKPAD